MDKINIYFFNKTSKKSSLQNIIISTHKLSNYMLFKEISNLSKVISFYDIIKKINIIFDKTMEIKVIIKILLKVHDILYSYKINDIIKKIKLHNVPTIAKNFMKELNEYKHIVMNPNKNPDIYLNWVMKNIPSNYNKKVMKVSSKFFPLTHAVSEGSNHDSHFVHIQPKKINKDNMNVYLIGKAVTFDSGGLNLKGGHMYDMKIDMTGSAIIMTVLKLLAKNNLDSHVNIHLLIPVVENMISSKATKPGSVITSMGGKTVEIVNTDAEGRLCMADCIEYICMKLLDKKKKNLILNIATLTGAAMYISDTISSIVLSNDSGNDYKNDIIRIGEECGDYLDTIKIRKEYLDRLNSNVADIKNIDYNTKAGTVLAGQFLEYFTEPSTPWLHLDVASTTYNNNISVSHGVGLLYEFILSL